MVLMFLARIPMTAMGITLTLHVVTELGRGYGAAGLIVTMLTAGTALGAPVIGRLLDRHGLRPVVAVCAAVSAAYWIAAPWMSYALLLIVALPAGALAVPSGALAKQILAALVPPAQLRTAYSLDSIAVELSFMIGPAGGILLATQVSSGAALAAIGLAYGVVGVAMCRMDPPIRSAIDAAEHAGARPPMREWLTPQLLRALLVAAGALFVLVGMEMAVLAALRDSGDLSWTALVMVILCAASIVGGVLHGAVRRSLPQLRLMVLLSALILPAALLVDPWWLLALALIPPNLACAPTLAATSEEVATLAPPRVRGEAVGLQDAAIRVGLALGSPVIGFVIDESSAGWGFVAAGSGGLLIAGAAFVLGRVRRGLPVVPVVSAGDSAAVVTPASTNQ